MRLYLIRHAQTEANLHPDLYPWDNNCPITAAGLLQATRLGDFLEASGFRPDRMIVSPLLRTCQTADVVARSLSMDFHTDGRLLEGNVGDWHAKIDATVYDFFQTLPVDRRFSYVPPGGESWQQAGHRVVQVVQDYLLAETLQGATGELLGNSFANTASYDFPNASLTILNGDGLYWQAECIGQDATA